MKGKAWKFGNDIDTDLILPGRYLVLRSEKDLAEHVMEGADPEFSKKVEKGGHGTTGTKASTPDKHTTGQSKGEHTKETEGKK